MIINISYHMHKDLVGKGYINSVFITMEQNKQGRETELIVLLRPLRREKND